MTAAWSGRNLRGPGTTRSGDRRTAIPTKLEVARRLLAALAAEERRPRPRFLLHRAQQRACARLVGVVSEPYLRLGDVRRDVADDARGMLVEDVRADPGLVQAIGDEISVVALACNVDANHGRHSDRAITRRSSSATIAAARAGS